MDKRREIYDALCRTLTDYEEGAAGGRDLYRMLCEIQRRWEDTITVQDLTCGWSHHENVLKDPAEILNTFRNRYYADGCSTENGIVAYAINDILPRIINAECRKPRDGEWKIVYRNKKATVYECTACGRLAFGTSDYCTCGAKMKGGK